MPVLVMLLLSVMLSPPFGEASARLIGFTPTEVTLEVSVEVVDSAAIVLMRGTDVAGTELEPVAMLQREDGTWGVVVELPARRDIRLLFELIPERGASTLSDAATLVELGIDPARLTLVDPPEPSDESTPLPGLEWVILAVLAAAAALALIAVWTRLGSRREPDEADAAADEHAGYDGVAVDGG